MTKSETVGGRVKPSTADELEQYADQRDITKSQAIEELIENGLTLTDPDTDTTTLNAEPDLEEMNELQTELTQLAEKVQQKVTAQEQQLEQQLTDHFDLAEINEEHLTEFANQPYNILPKDNTENEYYVTAPRFVPFHVGHLLEQTDAWNTFVVNKYVAWIEDIPTPIQEKIDLGERYEHAEIDQNERLLELADEDERDRAWDDLDGRDGGLHKRVDDDKIQIQKGKEFDVIAELVENGNLPFQPANIDETDLRPEPSNVSLRPYQERAWDTFKEYGQIGVYWPPGLGKTFLALYVGERIEGEKLVVVPSSTLESQWENRIQKHTDHPDEWTVKTYQYLTRHGNMSEYNGDNAPTLTVYDESHIVPANTYSKLATIDTDYRLGLSATPYREDERSVSADTDVLIRVNGEVKREQIETVYDEYRNEDIEVLTFRDGEVVWSEATAVTRHESDDTIQRVKTKSGRSIDVTDDHSVMVLGNDLSLKEKKASDLTEDDVCLTPKSIPVEKNEDTVSEREKKLAYILGWYIADGSLVSNKNGYWVNFSLNGEEQSKVEELKDALYEFEDHVGVSEDSGKGVKLVVSRKSFYNLLVDYGVEPEWNAHTKRVPDPVFDMPVEGIQEFLRGYYDGDAGVTVNRELSSDIMYLKSMVGDFSNRYFSLQEGTADFGTHTVEQSLMRYVVKDAENNSEFDRVPRAIIDSAFETALTQKRVDRQPKGRIESVNKHTFEDIVGPDAMERIELLSLTRQNDGITVPEVASEFDKSEPTAAAYLRQQRDRGLVEKIANGGSGTRAVWDMTEKGRTVLRRYNRLQNLFDGGYSFVEVKNVEEIDYNDEYVYDFTVPGTQTFVAGEGGLLTHNTDYIFALTGVPVGIEWTELLEYGDFDYPEVSVYLYRTQRQKREDLRELVNEPGETLVFCDSIDDGKALSSELDVPFVHGETPKDDRIDMFESNRVVIGSRVADEGLSLDDLDRVIEYDFHGRSRRQELQRAGRVMHSDGIGRHVIQMTDDEYDKYGKRLYSLEEKGIDIKFVRRA